MIATRVVPTVDEPARKRAYARSQQLVFHDVSIVFVVRPKNPDAYDARLEGFAPNPVTPSCNAQEWPF